MQAPVEQTVEINDNTYKLSVIDGVPSIERFNKKYDMWIKIRFIGTEEESKKIDKYVTDMLSGVFMDTLMQQA